MTYKEILSLFDSNKFDNDVHDKTPKYSIGQKYTVKRPKYTRDYKVVDILTTTNSVGEVVKIRYVAQHVFMGQVVTDYDVVGTTIARAVYGK